MASPSPSTWHTISPSTRPLSLTILELTPLALTLSLTLAIPSSSASASSSAANILQQQQQLAHPSSPSAALHHQRRKKRHAHAHAHGRARLDSDDENALEMDDSSDSPLPGAWPILNGEVRFKDLLSHGVVVSVNGQPWNRIVAHVTDEDADGTGEDEDEDDDEAGWGEDEAEADHSNGEEGNVTRRRPRKARFSLSAGHAAREAGLGERRKTQKKGSGQGGDRAVVVVYGLGPGKEYEIELRVVGMFGEGVDGIVSSSVLIPASPSPNPGLHPRSRANSLRSRSNPRSRSNSINGPADTPSPGRATPPSSATDATVTLQPPLVAPTPILSPSDAQAAQLRQHIAAAHAEKDHLQNQIKEARRASQRAEAALRVEIETVKRAIEKAGTMDMRAKQKTLALQEQVKQGWAGAESAEKEMGSVEAGLADLERVFEEVKLELDTVKDEWKVVKDREDEIRDRERRARAEEDKKLAEVVSKVDKLRSRREKRESEKVELERKLEDLEKQREEVERRNEEAKHRRGSGYWPQHAHPGAGAGVGRAGAGGWDVDAAGVHDARGLTNHPSMSNLGGVGPVPGAGAGPGFAHRGGAGRGGYGPRFPANGPIRPSIPPSAPSPTHPSAPFYNHSHPQPHPSSPSVRPPRSVSAAPLSNPSSSSTSMSTTGAPPSAAQRTISGGVNASAAPFHPSQTFTEHHTTMMPPQLQHRIYLPNVRPRPTPNFHPPPSVMAERQASPTSLSAPQFPPLPSTSTSPGPGASAAAGGGAGAGAGSSSSTSKSAAGGAGGPSLASIVTRAVLSPTSTLAKTTNPSPPASASASASSSQQRISFAPPPDKEHGNQPQPRGASPWSALPSSNNSGTGGGMVRTQTPPVMAIGEERWGRSSPAGSSGSGGRKGTE